MRTHSPSLCAGLLFAAFSATISLDAKAVGTRAFELNTLEELTGGAEDGVAISSNGVVRAGFSLHGQEFPDGVSAVTSSLRLADGTTLLGTSPSGQVFRVDGASLQLFADTKEIAVTSLAQTKAGVIYAGTTNGRVYRIASGKADAIATLPETTVVSALATDRVHDGIYAAGGSPGTIFRIDAAGTPTVYYRSDEPFIVSLAATESGVLYAGSQGKALLYRVSAPGRAEVVYDFPGDDVRAIAQGGHGTIYAINNEYADASDNAATHKLPSGRTPAGPAVAPRIKPGKGALYRFDEVGRPERLMHHDDTHYTALAVDPSGAPFVGTGVEGRVYSVDDAHVITLVADTAARQVTALDLSRDRPLLATSDAATVQRISARPAGESVWTSKALDAGIRATFGHLSWRASGTVVVSARTGNTAVPDSTWSEWSAQIRNGGAIQTPPGRYLQLRARWGGDATATLSQVVASFVTDNLRAIVTEVSLHGKVAAKEAKEGVVPSGGEPPKHDTVAHVTWKVDNPDNDQLRYYVQFAREGDSVWRDATRPDDILVKPELDWDTQTVPEGRYRLRVTASDELANPQPRVLSHSLDSAFVTIDNTPPVISSLEVSGRRLVAHVADGASVIARADFAIDGRLEWHPLDCSDGIFDALSETIDADLAPTLKPGPHVVALRVFDAAGNVTLREVTTK